MIFIKNSETELYSKSKTKANKPNSIEISKTVISNSNVKGTGTLQSDLNSQIPHRRYPTNTNLSTTNNNSNVNNLKTLELLTLAKNGDTTAKEKIISKNYGYILLHLKGIYLDGYTFDDLVQIGIESILKAINSFNINKPIGGFSPYVYITIKNNFNYLCRKEISHRELYNLNVGTEDGLELVDLIPSPENMEEDVVRKISLNEFLFKLTFLDSEEFQVIKFLYLDDCKEKRNLTDYAKINGKDYYYCVVLKRHALKKLRKNYNNFI